MNSVIIIAQFAIQYGIPAAQKLIALFEVQSPTAAQWAEVFALAEKPYSAYVPTSAPTPIPPITTLTQS